MQQLATLWNALDTRRRTIVVLATMAMFAAVLLLARMASAPSMALLYSGLENGAAGDVVAALEQRGAPYEVRGGAIFVDAAKRDTLRMTLAAEGLPANTAQGYELLDGLSGFGTTSQMFDAAYWRAKEGELARTIVSHPAINSARVHIATTGSNPFQRDVHAKASVMVTSASGSIAPGHARALRFLVASAVAGLAPEDVSIIDSASGLVGSAEDTPVHTPDDRAETMRKRIERLLEARVGSGNVVVEVSVDTVTRAESLRERRIDPETRVAISTETEERSDTAQDEGGGDVTVASNVPDGDAGAAESSQSQSTQTRERINYEISETEREVVMQPGAIKRLSVAVLVNGTTVPGPDGAETFQPRPEEELSALRELAASAVGYDESRGDEITIKTMQFEPAAPLGTTADPSFIDSLGLDLMSLIQAMVLGAVALILGLFVIRPVLMRSERQEPPQLAALAANPKAAPDASEALTGEIDTGEIDPAQLSLISRDALGQNETDASVPALARQSDDPVERLRTLIGERQEETVEILRNWLEGEEESA